MRLFMYPKKEHSAKAWLWRLLLGPASVLDGIVETLSFSFIGVGARLSASRNLAKSRLKNWVRYSNGQT